MIITVTNDPKRVLRAAIAPDGAVKVTRYAKTEVEDAWLVHEVLINADEWDSIHGLRSELIEPRQ
jgi:hypothetical protein